MGCKDCPPSFYRTDVVIADMDRCQPCSNCPPGFMVNPEAACNVSAGMSDRGCVECEAGQYNHNETNALSCRICPSGFFRKIYTVSQLALGKTNDPTSCEACSECQPGQYATGECSESALGTCQDCPAGFVSVDSNAASCTACPSGHFRSGQGKTECVACRTCPAGRAAACVLPVFISSTSAMYVAKVGGGARGARASLTPPPPRAT